jgi:Tfp pilus assembly protein PilP
MASGMAMAQTAPPSQKVAPDSKPAAAKPAMTKAKPAAAPKKSAAASPIPPKPAMAPAKAKAKPAATKVKKAATPAAATAKAPGKRDPFTSPIREQAMGPPCTTGKKCLAINSIVLRGIVKSQAGMIAVVETSARRISYFLRENDPVFNGYVVKITGDTVVFRENVMDRLGKQTSRDVVMKVVAPVV